jgi:hypothetical protein
MATGTIMGGAKQCFAEGAFKECFSPYSMLDSAWFFGVSAVGLS